MKREVQNEESGSGMNIKRPNCKVFATDWLMLAETAVVRRS